MKHKQLSFSFLLLLVLVGGCGKPLPTLDSINIERWQQDKFACSGYRATVLHELDIQKDKLLALDEQKIMALLGRPDRNELYKRNQKFFYYDVKPAAACNPAVADSAARSPHQLTIRFNAMGLAKEVMIE
jgi:hypothetical protein